MNRMKFTQKRIKNIILSSVILICLHLEFVKALSNGHYSAYDMLCVSQGEITHTPWDCSGYIRCDSAPGNTTIAVWTQCGLNKQFDPQNGVCSDNYTGCPTPQIVASTYCPEMPDLLFPHPASCSMFYNCSRTLQQPGGLKEFEGECTYPYIFDARTFACVPRPTAAVLLDLCGSRPIPQFPCDYATGCQLSQRCQGLPDGNNSDPTRPFTSHYVSCVNNTVERNLACEESAGQIFDPLLKYCVTGIRDESVTDFCKRKPGHIFADPYNCGRYYNCSQQTSLHPSLRYKQTECRYPSLFNAVTFVCENFNLVECGTREEPIQPCDYIVGHCIDRSLCIPCDASCLGLPNGYNAIPGYVLTAYHMMCEAGRTVNLRNCSVGLVFDPQVRKCGPEISTLTLDKFCAENPNGKLAHPTECSLLYDCTRLTDIANFPKYVSECKYPYLVDDSVVQCKPHDQVDCRSRREPISPCDYVGNKCTSTQCTNCELIMPSCYGKLNGLYPIINQEMTSAYMECRDQRVVSLSSCPGGLIFDMVERKCVDTISEVSMLQFCTNYLQGRVQNPSNCAQYYDCTKNLTRVQECRYPDLYHVETKDCKHYSEVECKGRHIFLDPCDSYTFCPVSPCLYCPTAFPTCLDRNGTSGGFLFDDQLYYRCIDNRLILGRCQTTFNWKLKQCNEIISVTTNTTALVTPAPKVTTAVVNVTITSTLTTIKPTTTTKATAKPTTTTPKSITTAKPKITTIFSPLLPLPSDVNTTCRKDPGFIAPKGDNCAQYYNCSNVNSPLGPFISECSIGFLFDTARGLCAPRSTVTCQRRYEPLQACDYKLQNCPVATVSSSCVPCSNRFSSCSGKPDGPLPLPRELSSLFLFCRNGRAEGLFTCPHGQFMDPKERRCTSELTMNTTAYFCTLHPDTLSAHPLHCARYILCKRIGVMPMEGECPYPNLFFGGICKSFKNVNCGSRYEPKEPCEYASMQACQDKTRPSCAPCKERFPSCRGIPNGNWPYPGQLLTSLFVKCDTERTMAVVKCMNSYFHPLTRQCGAQLNEILLAVARAPMVFCSQYPQAVVADPLHCARYYNCSLQTPGRLGRPYLSECRYPSLFNRQTMQCDSFITVLHTVGCGRSKQPLHQCEYLSYCPGTRYRTCSDCYLDIPNCQHLSDGIHTIPAGLFVSQGFVYCLDQRSLVYSECPPEYVYLSTAQTCVLRSSLITTEPAEVK